MTNAEKYLKDGISTENLMFVLDNAGVAHANNGRLIIYAYDLQEFLNAPAKPTLTEDEKVILRNIDKNFIVIGRDDRGNLYTNTNAKRTDDIYYEISIFDHLFQFIQPRRRI